MFKKIIAVIGCIGIMISYAINVSADDDTTTTINKRKVFLYPMSSSLSIEVDIPPGQTAVERKQYKLSSDENALSVSFKFKSEFQKKDIMFMSLYDINEEIYITPNNGVAATAADEFTFTGLTPEHVYRIGTSALFKEKTIDAVISKKNIPKAEISAKENRNVLPAAADIPAVSFDDIVLKLKELGIVNGYDDGSVRPDNKITRAEVCAIINRVIRQGKNSVTFIDFRVPFTDVKKDSWFYNDVMNLIDLEFINGYENNVFKPQDDITYNEYIKIASSLLFCEPYAETNGSYPDGYIAAAERLNLTKGIIFNGDDKITRKDAMKILYNTINSPIVLVKNYNVGSTHEYESSNISYMDFLQ
ncbi:MAG: S-layer homology domain-containing protein [Clostridia bacterium]|nr:S-layer homology domain-containing protein [Clostridia bacterium]